jgi:hypothetical protein
MQLVDIALDVVVVDFINDPPLFNDIVPVRDDRREPEVLLDENDGEPLALEPKQGSADLLNDDGREAFRRLVEQQKLRAGAQDSANRQHLLLAAGEFRAEARKTLLQVWEELENLRD